jgi:hypothetical protein
MSKKKELRSSFDELSGDPVKVLAGLDSLCADLNAQASDQVAIQANHPDPAVRKLAHGLSSLSVSFAALVLVIQNQEMRLARMEKLPPGNKPSQPQRPRKDRGKHEP